MAESLRGAASIAIGGVGFAVGGPIGFAVASVAFNFLVPPKVPKDKSSRALQEERNTAVGTGIFEVYGHWEREGGDLIRCAKDKDGVRSGILIVTKEEKQGGALGSGKNPGSNKTKRDYQYLQASFELCAGFAQIDRMIEMNGKDGEKVVWIRDGSSNFCGEWQNNVQYEVGDSVDKGRGQYICKESHLSSVDIDPGDETDDDPPLTNWRTYWSVVADKKSLVKITPIYGSASGKEIGLMSETVRFYYGSEEQPVDGAEAGWYDGGVSADRGICKVVFNKYGPLESGTTFKFLLSNDRGERREIIRSRMMRAGVPSTRIDIRSIPAGVVDYGWAVEGRESARTLPENVASLAFHDLHFLATSRGMCFTDVSLSNPTIFVIPDALAGAYANSGGGGSPQSILNGTIQSGETKPRELSVEFYNQFRNFKSESTVAQWQSAQGEPQTMSFKLISDVEQMGDWVEIAMRAIQAVDGTGEISLMPAYSEVACGCVLDMSAPLANNPLARKQFRIVSQAISPEGLIANTCAPYDPSAFEPVPLHPVTIEPEPSVRSLALPQIILLDVVNVVDETVLEPFGLMLGTCNVGEDWGGAVVTSLDGAFDDVSISFQASVGTSQTALTFVAKDSACFDYSKTLRVKLSNGALVSASEEAVRSGANVILLGQMFLSFVTAAPLGGGVYDLTGILGGLYGTDAGAVYPVGTRVVKITDNNGFADNGVVPVQWVRRFVGSPTKYRSYSAENPDEISDELLLTLTGENLVPQAVSPWITKGSDVEGTGLLLRFFGRSRYPETGRDFMQAGISIRHADPLSWTVRLIGDDTAVLDERTVSSLDAEVTVHYTEAELIVIYGTVPITLKGEVFQNGTFGMGRVRSFEV